MGWAGSFLRGDMETRGRAERDGHKTDAESRKNNSVCVVMVTELLSGERGPGAAVSAADNDPGIAIIPLPTQSLTATMPGR